MIRVRQVLLVACLLLVSVVDADESAVLDPQEFDLSQLKDREELAFEESAAYYAILDHVRHVDLPALRETAAEFHRQRWEASETFHSQPEDEFPLFYDLTQRPEAYRGRPVTMRGHLVRLTKYAAGPNDFGIETLYEGWLVTPDAQTHPTTVICTQIPEGMPIGEELIDGVSVTGYFFKLHTYPSRDKKIRFAPMVLAHTLSWSPTAGADAGWPVAQPLMIAGVLLLAIIAAFVAVISSRRAKRAREKRFEETIPGTPPDFLNDLTP